MLAPHKNMEMQTTVVVLFVVMENVFYFDQINNAGIFNVLNHYPFDGLNCSGMRKAMFSLDCFP